MNDEPSVAELNPDDPRPVPYRRHPGARLSAGKSGPEGAEHFLRAPGGALLVLGEREKFLWDALDGTRPFRAIGRGFHARFAAVLTPAQFAAFLAELAAVGAVERIADADRLAAGELAAVRRISLPDDPIGASPEAATSRAAARRGGAAASLGGRSRGIRVGMRELWSHPLGNPERLFDILKAIFWPLRITFWMLIPAVIVAFLISIKHSTEYFADWSAMMLSIPQWPCLWLAEHVTTWSARIAEGMVIHGFGGRVKHAQIKLFLGIFIRIHFDETSTKTMPRRQRLWIVSTPLLWRLAIFAVAMVVWALYRPVHPIVAQVALFMAFMGLVTFVMCSCPLIPLYGYKFLGTLLDQENLYGRALRFLVLRLKGRPAPGHMTVAERWGLVFMAVGTAIFSTAYVGHILYSANVYSVTHLGAPGGIFGFTILAMCALYFISLWRLSARLRAMRQAERLQKGQPDTSGSRP